MDSPDFTTQRPQFLPTPPSEQHLNENAAKESSAWLSIIPPIDIDEIFSLNAAFLEDAHPQKVNLGMGVYRTAEGHSWPLPSVSAAELKVSQTGNSQRHDYLPSQGDAGYLELARDLLFGDDLSTKKDIISYQTLSGSGANHVAAVFLSDFLRPSRVWLSDPTWQNHSHIWSDAGVPISYYPYFDHNEKTFAFAATLKTLDEGVLPGDVVLLQACAHNPTGQDPTPQQWRDIASLLARKQAVVLFDCAYQGFASGDPFADAWAVRYFATAYPNMPLIAAQSFSKTFGLYGQRAGALHMCLGRLSQEVRQRIVDNITVITRAEYSFPPRGGSTLVKTVLSDASLKSQWLQDLKTMSTRIRTMRVALHAALVQLKTPGSWDHIVQQIGMFSYTGLTAEDSQHLQQADHIYLLKSGRISLSGLNSENVGRVAAAIDRVVRLRLCANKGAFGWIDSSEVDIY